MSDGITLICPSCGEYSAVKKEYDKLDVLIQNPDHESKEDYLEHSIPVYTCQKCGKKWAIERVIWILKRRLENY